MIQIATSVYRTLRCFPFLTQLLAGKPRWMSDLT
jgi:hypothetical protein